MAKLRGRKIIYLSPSFNSATINNIHGNIIVATCRKEREREREMRVRGEG